MFAYLPSDAKCYRVPSLFRYDLYICRFRRSCNNEEKCTLQYLVFHIKQTTRLSNWPCVRVVLCTYRHFIIPIPGEVLYLYIWWQTVYCQCPVSLWCLFLLLSQMSPVLHSVCHTVDQSVYAVVCQHCQAGGPLWWRLPIQLLPALCTPRCTCNIVGGFLVRPQLLSMSPQHWSQWCQLQWEQLLAVANHLQRLIMSSHC